MDERVLTAERLREVLQYHPETGQFTWKLNPSCVRIGKIAGTLLEKGYVKIAIDKRAHMAHRLAWLYVHGEWPDGYIDHINRNKSDNRISNLRVVGRNENMQNQGLHKRNTSGFRGVSEFKNRWRARISVNGKDKYLGRFKDKESAYEAYLKAAAKYHTHNPFVDTQNKD